MLRHSESTNRIKTSKERLRFNTQFFVRQMGRPREFTADLQARLLPAVTLRTEGASGNFHPKLGFDVLYDGRPGGGHRAGPSRREAHASGRLREARGTGRAAFAGSAWQDAWGEGKRRD